MAEQVFVQHLEEVGILPRYGSAEGAINLGRTICYRYDAGGTRADVIRVLGEGGMPEPDAVQMNSAAIVAFCPQHGQHVVS